MIDMLQENQQSAIPRRTFLKTIGAVGGAGLASLLASCCTPDDRREKGKVIILYPYEIPQWEDISIFINKRLEEGIAIDFEKYEDFGDIIHINNMDYSREAIGTRIKQEDMIYTTTQLKRTSQGISLDLIEGNQALTLAHIGDNQKITLDDKEYEVHYESLTIPQGREGDTAYFPLITLEINGRRVNIREGKAHLDNLSLCLDLNTFHPPSASFFLSHHHFSSRTDLGDDTQLSGLEHILKLSANNQIRGRKEENKYNGQQQDNAYFRLDTIPGKINSGEPIKIRRIEKIRVFIEGITTPKRPVTTLDVMNKEREINQKPIELPEELFDQTLENSFSFDFDPPIKTRTGGLENQVPGLGITYPQEMFSYRFSVQTEGGEREFLIRYIGIDTSIIPSSRKNIFYPKNAIFTEILEDPQEISLEQGESHIVEASDGVYRLTFSRVSLPPEVGAGIGALCLARYYFDIEKEGEKRTISLRALHYGPDVIAYEQTEEGTKEILGDPNRIGSFNLEPDISQYPEGRIRDRRNHRFFLSRSKFSSAQDFFDDNQFTGRKKILDISGNRPQVNEINSYDLANRYNGEIQENAYFRVLADFGVKEFKRVGDDRYEITENRAILDRTQFEQGYFLKIYRMEKVLR